jgi:hypothetical protein
VLLGFIRLVGGLRTGCLLRMKCLLRHLRAGLRLRVEFLLLRVELLLWRLRADDLRHLRTGLLRYLRMGGRRVLLVELLLRVELLGWFLCVDGRHVSWMLHLGSPRVESLGGMLGGGGRAGEVPVSFRALWVDSGLHWRVRND